MKSEVSTACRFLFLMLRSSNRISEPKLKKFTSKIEELLCERYKTHWHPQNPLLGSGFRCIRINNSAMDPIVLNAALLTGLSNTELSGLPEELTLWIDPNEVCFRIGENGSICDISEDMLKDMTTRAKEKASRQRAENLRKKENLLHSNILQAPTCVQC